MKKILFVLGTAREGRKSEQVAQYVLSVARKRTDIEPTLIDVRNFPQSSTTRLSTELGNRWNTLIKETDGLIIISPEYNHGYPGELKLLLDNAYDVYEGKPVAICGVSNGPLGGARMAEQLKLVLSAFQMTIINAAVYFSNVNELFETSGEIKDPEYWEKRVNGMIDQVMKYAQ